MCPDSRRGGGPVRNIRWLSILLAAALLLSACGSREIPQEAGGFRLWFAADEGQANYGHGPALDSEAYAGVDDPGPEELLSALLAGPTLEGLRSPFPRGVTLRQLSWDEERPGVLLVGFSEQYGALADISLTLADYCVVLTLAQVEGVDTVEIFTQGYQASYRSHQLLDPQEAVLRDELAETAPENT